MVNLLCTLPSKKNVLQTLTFILMFIFLFLSYTQNFFNVVSKDDFHSFQIDSELLVVDGLLYARNSNSNFSMGAINRSLSENHLPTRDAIRYSISTKEFNTDSSPKKIYDEFEPYTSQYGLQFKMFYLIERYFNITIYDYKRIVATLMVIVVILMLLAIKSKFGNKTILPVFLLFLFSPFIVKFAGNLYWVTFTWFLPVLVTSFFSVAAFACNRKLILLMVLLFIVFTIKFLCGFEYITTIGISSVIPLIYIGLRENQSNKKIIYVLSGVITVFSLSFILSLFFYTSQYGTDNLEEIINKRISFKEIEEQKNDFCKHSSIADCSTFFDEKLAPDLTAPVSGVVGRYLVFEGFIPWLYTTHLSPKDKIKLIQFIKKPNDIDALRNMETNTYLRVLSMLLGSLIFYVMTIKALLLAQKRRGEIFLVLLTVISPISWFILASGHSSKHIGINDVLWFLPTLPFLLVYILGNYQYTAKESVV